MKVQKFDIYFVELFGFSSYEVKVEVCNSEKCGIVIFQNWIQFPPDESFIFCREVKVEVAN